MVSSSCSNSGTHRVALVRDPMMNEEMGKGLFVPLWNTYVFTNITRYTSLTSRIQLMYLTVMNDTDFIVRYKAIKMLISIGITFISYTQYSKAK